MNFLDVDKELLFFTFNNLKEKNKTLEEKNKTLQKKNKLLKEIIEVQRENTEIIEEENKKLMLRLTLEKEDLI